MVQIFSRKEAESKRASLRAVGKHVYELSDLVNVYFQIKTARVKLFEYISVVHSSFLVLWVATPTDERPINCSVTLNPIHKNN